jgi:hypothetical protein
MTTLTSNRPICGICDKPIVLDTSKVDELGKTIHEGCCLLKVSLRRATTPPQHS